MTTETIIISVGLVALLFLFLLVIIIVMFFQIRRLQNNKGEVSLLLPQMAIITEKLSQIEPINQTASVLQAEVRGLGERIGTVKSNQNIVYQGVNLLGNEVRGLAERIRNG